MMSWSENIWKRGMSQYERILRHPFLHGLADGTLAPERFARYMAQDELYLPAYCSLMHRLAGLMPDEEDRSFMHTFADAGGESEREMHLRLIERFSVNTDVQPSAVTKGYRSFLEAAVDGGDAATATAAMLPCSWVYNNVGLHIGEIAELEGNPYREWIEAYGDSEYGRMVSRMVSIADALAEASDEEGRKCMDKAFLDALGFEFAFWDYAYSGDDRNFI